MKDSHSDHRLSHSSYFAAAPLETKLILGDTTLAKCHLNLTSNLSLLEILLSTAFSFSAFERFDNEECPQFITTVRDTSSGLERPTLN
ncbi:hypothetical protein CEXT_9461 [Caerostris extrusa]|uniref:Uncharacterized protein n=1 Tax=Caerostris extrusa TaxID=172846 RepID=A0AAV4P0Y7_CAEEX|nr:hypothetical protein CEXT_9461 [Caerostris extrusa]